MLRYCMVQDNDAEVLALTCLTMQEFTELVPIFHRCIDSYLKEYTIDKKTILSTTRSVHQSHICHH